MPDCKVPVLFLTFNRPRQTRLALERILLAGPSKIYVHSDGPRAHIAGEAEKVEEVRTIIRTQIGDRVPVLTLFRSENMGLRAGVFDALNWFFDREPQGIVLEDDCVPDLTFFPFCAEILQRYADDEQVMHIGGSNLAEAHTAGLGTSFVFSRFTFVWGWASWRRAWQKMSLQLDGLDEFEQSGAIQNYLRNPMAQAYMLDKFRVTRSGKNNSWAYAWFYSVLKNKGLCVVPTLNLVQNVGIGSEDATHTTRSNDRAQLRARTLAFPLVFPEHREPDPLLEQQFFYHSQKSRFRLRLWYVLQRFGLRPPK